MNEIDFAKALERELHGRGLEVDRGELLEFVEDVWKRVGNQPDVRRWASEYMRDACQIA